MTAEERMVIFASSLGTVFEWYDFYIYGTLAPILAAQFFSGVNPTAAFIFTLLAFAAGFAVRPFGALFFGRLGDLIGRKYTFLVTMTLMGVGTFFIGLLPTYAVGRHRRAGHPDRSAPAAGPRARRRVRRRGDLRRRACAARTSAASTPRGSRPPRRSACSCRCSSSSASAPAMGEPTRSPTGAGAFRSCSRRSCSACRSGSGCSSTSRRLFQRMKDEGKQLEGAADGSLRPWENAKIAILALLGATAGQAVVWYGGQFYALFFLTQTLKVPDGHGANPDRDRARCSARRSSSCSAGCPTRSAASRSSWRASCSRCVTYFPIFQGAHALRQPGAGSGAGDGRR